MNELNERCSAMVMAECITPAIAVDMLEHNNINRKLKRNIVEQYKSDMLNHRWTLCTDNVISFDTEGNLINGQHRLTAISELPEDSAVWCFVGRNNPPKVMQSIDTGCKRSYNDTIRCMGIDNAMYSNESMGGLAGRILKNATGHTASYMEKYDFIGKYSYVFSFIYTEIRGKVSKNVKNTDICFFCNIIGAMCDGVEISTINELVKVLCGEDGDSTRYNCKKARQYVAMRFYTEDGRSEMERRSNIIANMIYCFANNVISTKKKIDYSFTIDDLDELNEKIKAYYNEEENK